jgi:hypothetical protein
MMALLISSYRPNVKGEAIASDSVSDSKWGKIVSETGISDIEALLTLLIK